MWKISQVFGLRTSGNPLNCQISHYWYAWGQLRSVTPDDLWKVNMQCQRSHVVICSRKSRIMSPFQSLVASPVAKNTISLIKSVGGYTSYDVIARWSDLTRSKNAKATQMMPHKLCKISARSAQRFGGHFRKKLIGVFISIPPPRCTGES